MSKFTRRSLIAGGLVGGAFAVGYALVPPRPEWNGPLGDDEVLVNNWVKIGPDGFVTVYVAQAEMGQGIHSGFASILAEEMDADWSRMRVRPAPDHPSYSNIMFASAAIPFVGAMPEFMQPAGKWLIKEILDRTGLIATGGSSSMRDKYLRLRQAGALARMTMLQAAADVWGVPVDACSIKQSVVYHRSSGKQLDFGELVQQAAQTSVRGDVTLKPKSQFAYIGNESRKRLDIPSKVTGEAVFGADVRLDGMLYAAVRNGGGSLGTIKASNARMIKNQPGVIDVVETDTWIGVVGRTQWHAQQAADALDIDWERGAGAQMVAGWQDQRVASASQNGTPATIVHQDETIETAFADAADVFTATYSVPYLAHVCLETMNATARWSQTGLEVWAPNQSPTIMKMGLSAALDIDAGSITVNTTLLGGGFGRKVEPDCVIQAATMARAVGQPVQLIWSRKEDIHGDVYRPAAAATMTAALDAQNEVRGVKAHVASQSVGAGFQGRWFGGSGTYEGRDPTTVEGLEVPPYGYASYQLGYTDQPAAAQVGYWRSVGHSYTAFFAEAFADELAERAGEDPVAYRLKRMTSPRAKAVLQKAANMAGYGAAPAGRYHGVAFHESYGSLVAMVVEIMPEEGEDMPAITRVFAAVDCGMAINPDTVRAQIQGSIVFGLTAAMFGEVTFDGGVPEQDNFDSYRLLSLKETPQTQIEVINSDGALGGVGETGVPPVAPALANAVYQWRGKRVRSLPLIQNLREESAAGSIASAAGF